MPDAGHLRNVEHRELFLSGLRLAADAANPRLTGLPPG
jgi:hypothetical protein